ncbi:MAG TPA: amidohydrolase [Clostridia bacterium]|nr:amidohydrolase [Clostridia bacterium]
MRTLIKNIRILTMDEKQTQYDNGCIVIEGDRISFLGYETALPEGMSFNIIEDGMGKLAMPGFINTHTHLGMTIFRGYANDLGLMEWLSQKIWPLEDQLMEGDLYWLSLLAIAEMIRAGITTFADMYMFMEQTAQATYDSGIRGALARGLQGPDEKSDMRLMESEELWKNWHGRGDDRIRIMLGPHAIYTCQPSYLHKCIDMANKLGVGIHIHLSETQKEVEDSIREYGKTPVKHLYDMGLFDGQVLAAHCVHLSDKDIEILKEKDVKVSHCPISNLKLGSGIAPIERMLDRGITVSLGTDGVASNNNLSIMKEMSMAALITKGVTQNPRAIPAIRALKMATNYGASALGWDKDIGSLSLGKKADIVLVDIDLPHYHPWADTETHLVYSGQSQDIHSLWVNGRRLMRGRELITVDLDRVYYEVNRIHSRIMGDE